jgi:hypothetical protein
MSVNIASLLEGVRKRPGIYLSPVSIFSLQTFLTGYEIGRSSRARKVVPRDFTDWVAYRLHVSGTARGWARIIAEQQGDGEHAIECFFTLLDEHRVRVPQTVAILSK